MRYTDITLQKRTKNKLISALFDFKLQQLKYFVNYY